MSFEASLMSCVSLAMGGMGNDSLITKKRSHPVERLNCIEAAAFSQPHSVNVPMMTGVLGGGR